MSSVHGVRTFFRWKSSRIGCTCAGVLRINVVLQLRGVSSINAARSCPACANRIIIEMISIPSSNSSLVSLAATNAAAGNRPVQKPSTCTGLCSVPKKVGFASA